MTGKYINSQSLSGQGKQYDGLSCVKIWTPFKGCVRLVKICFMSRL